MDCSSGDHLGDAGCITMAKIKRLIISNVGEHAQQACQSGREFDMLEELSCCWWKCVMI